MPDNIAFEGIEVKLDKIRHIRYTFASMRIIIKKYGSLQKALSMLEQVKIGDLTEETLDVLSTLIYAGLVHEDEELNQVKVENMIDFRGIAALVNVITTAMSGSLPDGGEEKNAPGPA